MNEVRLLIAQSFLFSNCHARPFGPRCSKKSLRGFQQLIAFIVSRKFTHVQMTLHRRSCYLLFPIALTISYSLKKRGGLFEARPISASTPLNEDSRYRLLMQICINLPTGLSYYYSNNLDFPVSYATA